MKQKEVENPFSKEDPLRGLLESGDTSKPKVSPLFTKNVIREIRNEEMNSNAPLSSTWQSFLAKLTGFRTLSATSLAILSVSAITIYSLKQPSKQTSLEVAVKAPEAQAQSVDSLDVNLLTAAAEDRSFLNNAEIALLLF